nr:hypothetical protein Iba_chr07dCG12830 [Ipomoea batatas]
MLGATVFEVGCLLLADLLHLEHPLHNKLVFALLVGVALVLALPRQVQLRLAALVERDQQVGALVPVSKRHLRLNHLCLRSYHLLRRPWHLHLSLDRLRYYSDFGVSLVQAITNVKSSGAKWSFIVMSDSPLTAIAIDHFACGDSDAADDRKAQSLAKPAPQYIQ